MMRTSDRPGRLARIWGGVSRTRSALPDAAIMTTRPVDRRVSRARARRESDARARPAATQPLPERGSARAGERVRPARARVDKERSARRHLGQRPRWRRQRRAGRIASRAGSRTSHATERERERPAVRPEVGVRAPRDESAPRLDRAACAPGPGRAPEGLTRTRLGLSPTPGARSGRRQARRTSRLLRPRGSRRTGRQGGRAVAARARRARAPRRGGRSAGGRLGHDHDARRRQAIPGEVSPRVVSETRMGRPGKEPRPGGNGDAPHARAGRGPATQRHRSWPWSREPRSRGPAAESVTPWKGNDGAPPKVRREVQKRPEEPPGARQAPNLRPAEGRPGGAIDIEDPRSSGGKLEEVIRREERCSGRLPSGLRPKPRVDRRAAIYQQHYQIGSKPVTQCSQDLLPEGSKEAISN